MIRALYSSATGMKAQEMLIDVTANNLANVNTNGFKRSQLDFADLLYSRPKQAGSPVDGLTSPIGIEIGSGVRPVGTTKSFTPGTFEQTGIATDVAIEGDGFIQVTVNGETRYTRDGALRRGSDGALMTGDGYLLTDGITIPSTAQSVAISPSGEVSYTEDGTPTTAGQITLARFANPAGLNSEGSNLYSLTEAAGAPTTGNPGDAGFGTLRGRMLERSNVEVVTELISLITAQRAYEINSRAIRAGDEMLSTTTDIVR
ncbi:flagellar basal-body rod protein FlgG [Planctomycetota bacterium]